MINSLPKIIFTILFLPLQLIYISASAKAAPAKKIFSFLIILGVYGGIWFSGYIQTAMLLYYGLYDAGIIATAKDVHVVGESMMPTIKNDTYVDLQSPKKYPIERGDIVSFSNLETGNASYIKRVIAVPGDRVSVRNGQVILNGQILDEPYILNDLPTYGNTFIQECAVYTVPPDSYLVMGDNRTVSMDSRVIGFVSKKDIGGVIKSKIKAGVSDRNPDISKARSSPDPVLLFNRINQFRLANQEAAFMSDPDLTSLASLRAKQIKNSLADKQVFPDIETVARKSGYGNYLIHEYVVYGYLTEDETVSQIQEITSENDSFLSPKYYNLALGESRSGENECSVPIIVILISWPKIPVYDPLLIDKWQNEEKSVSSLIQSVASLAGNTGIDPLLLDKLTNSLVRQSEISSRLYRKMTAREWLNETDNNDARQYPGLVTESNRLIEQLMTRPDTVPSVNPQIKPSPTPTTYTGKFTSYGSRMVEPGTSANIKNLVFLDKSIEADVQLSNFSQQPVKISPLRFQIHSTAAGGSVSPTISQMTVNPLESRVYKLSFDRLDDPPFRFLYVNSDGIAVDLGYYLK